MKVRVRLFGTLRLRAPAYDPSQGLVLEIPDDATVKDLLDHLEIPEIRGAVVITEGRAMEVNSKLQDGGSLDIFQTIQGGC